MVWKHLKQLVWTEERRGQRTEEEKTEDRGPRRGEMLTTHLPQELRRCWRRESETENGHQDQRTVLKVMTFDMFMWSNSSKDQT